MMWQVLRGLGGRYAPSGGYDNPDAGLTPTDPSRFPLDPIHCAGQANLSFLKGRLRSNFTIRALCVVMSIAAFMAEVQPPGTDYLPQTNARWQGHIDVLSNEELTYPQPMLVEISKSLVLGVCTYFAVMKGTDGVRAIFNGKRFSSRCATPPPTNLPDINVLFAALLRLPGKITMVEGDVRHFFHQIKLHYDISRFFCIRMHQKFWRWATLPMGWSWSPFIAQSISFGVIIETLSDCGESVSMYRDLHVPPSLIEIPGRLVAAVW
jgi:hypothetical protein